MCRGVLFQHFESPEEGTRNVVAECLGKLTLVDPETLLPKLRENLKSESMFVRSTVVTALKYTISDQPQPIDTLLHSCIGDFLSTIGDPDLVSYVKAYYYVSVNLMLQSCILLIEELVEYSSSFFFSTCRMSVVLHWSPSTQRLTTSPLSSVIFSVHSCLTCMWRPKSG